MSSTIIIAGAGLAGLRTAVQLRSAGWEGSLIVIGDEAHLPYNRPPLTKAALRSGVDLGALTFGEPDPSLRIEFQLETRVVGCDLDARRLAVSRRDGTSGTMTYDGLVVATGVRPRRLAIPGALTRRHTLRTAEHAAVLHQRLAARATVVVIGAGFIGCEVAASARAMGCDVTVVDPLGAPLERALGRSLGTELRRRHETRGVRFELGRTVVAIETQDDASVVVLDDGRQLRGGVLLEAVGSTPNTEWLAGQGLDLSDGLLCDGGLHPLRADGSIGNVVAIGDVARFPIRSYGDEPLRIEHWNMPGDTAGHAAQSLLAGLDRTEAPTSGVDPLPTFWSDQYDDRILVLGVPARGFGDVRVLEGELDQEAVVGFHRDGLLVGLALLGKRGRMPHYRTRLADDLRAAQVGAAR